MEGSEVITVETTIAISVPTFTRGGLVHITVLTPFGEVGAPIEGFLEAECAVAASTEASTVVAGAFMEGEEGTAEEEDTDAKRLSVHRLAKYFIATIGFVLALTPGILQGRDLPTKHSPRRTRMHNTHSAPRPESLELAARGIDCDAILIWDFG